MRQPLLMLVSIYAIAVLGLVLIPGVDADGHVWHMSFFHAIYFVSYMATTIGFGELPQAFSDAQRLWVIVMIYATVVSWIYSIGALISLVQNHSFQQAWGERRFTNQVRRITEPFYLVCGYGETGQMLVHSLLEDNHQAVVLDKTSDAVDLTTLEDQRLHVPSLQCDAAEPNKLILGGLKHARCAGVIALTHSNDTNLQIALSSKLLSPSVPVVCQADSHEYEANMASFGTDYIIDPFDTFATYLVVALQSPCLFLLRQWLTGNRHQELEEPIYPPGGKWIVCGYGRFGKAVVEKLKKEHIELIIIEATPRAVDAPKGTIRGWGTEAETLLQAGIKNAQGIVAGTNNDANNLSIVMTAKKLNPDLFVVLRQNRTTNKAIFEAIGADMLMHPSHILATKVRVLLATPLLNEFISLGYHQEDAWACELISRISALVQIEVPEVWEIKINDSQAHAVFNAIKQAEIVTMGNLLHDTSKEKKPLWSIPLLLHRGNDQYLLPDNDFKLKQNDHILFCGSRRARLSMEWILLNQHLLNYVLTGESVRQSVVWRWLSKT